MAPGWTLTAVSTPCPLLGNRFPDGTAFSIAGELILGKPGLAPGIPRFSPATIPIPGAEGIMRAPAPQSTPEGIVPGAETPG